MDQSYFITEGYLEFLVFCNFVGYNVLGRGSYIEGILEEVVLVWFLVFSDLGLGMQLRYGDKIIQNSFSYYYYF